MSTQEEDTQGMGYLDTSAKRWVTVFGHLDYFVGNVWTLPRHRPLDRRQFLIFCVADRGQCPEIEIPPPVIFKS